jgi:hypothetical protein
MKTISLISLICLIVSIRTAAQIHFLSGDQITDFYLSTTLEPPSNNFSRIESEALSNFLNSTQQFKVMTKKEMKELQNAVKNDPASAEEYKAYQTSNSISWVLLACSFGGSIYGLVNMSKYSKETDVEKEEIYATRTKAGLAVGIGCLIIDWPVSHAGRKHLKKAFEQYNAAHSQVSLEDLSLFYGSGGLQIGFQFKF